jgi:uncharacterized protein involved in exopolysaccharide biosynthesis
MRTYQPTLRDITEMYLRRRLPFSLVCALVLACGGAYLLIKQPVYESKASLVLHFDSQSVPDIDRMRTPSQMDGSNEHREILYTDADILRSRDRAHEVIEAVGLSRLYPNIAKMQVTDAHKMDLAEGAFANDLVVDEGLQSDVLNLSLFNPDAAVAKDALQKLIDRFYAQEADVYANPQITFAESESRTARQKLTQAQNDLAAFKASYQIADPQQQESQLLGARTDVENRIRLAQSQLLEAQQRESALKELLADIPQNTSSSAAGEQFRTVDDAETALDALKAKRSEMSSNYLPTSEVFKRIDAQIGSLQAAVSERGREARSRSATKPNEVYQSIKTDYVRAQATVAAALEPQGVLNKQLDDLNKRLNDLEAQRNRFDDLTRAVQIQNDTYRTLAIRYETARVEANRNAQRISAAVVIAAPTLPIQPARPRRKMVALATLLAAVLSGSALILLIEAFDDRVRTAADVRRLLELPVVATFPEGR